MISFSRVIVKLTFFVLLHPCRCLRFNDSYCHVIFLPFSLPYFIEYEELVMPTFFINVFLPPSSSGNRKDNPLGESHYRL